MPKHRYLFLDDGGVMNSSALRQPQWIRLVGEYLSPRLGGSPQAWAEANTATFQQVFTRQQERLAGWHDGRDYLSEMRLTNIDWLASMCVEMGIETPSVDECAELGRATQTWIMSQVVAGYPGVTNAVDELSKSYEIYTASGSTSFELGYYTRSLGIEGYFKRLYGADLIQWPKLGPEFHRRIFADAGVEPAECIVVDDQAPVIAWAQEAGAFTVHAKSANAEPSNADLTIELLAELPAALRALD